MKSTYKLLGVFWDQRPIPEEFPELVDCEEIQDYREEYNLFDLAGYRREVKLTELLSIENVEKLNSIIKLLRKCDKAYLHIDYIPRCELPVVCNFFVRRTMQIYRYIKESVQPEIEVFVMADDRERFESICREHYTSK